MLQFENITEKDYSQKGVRLLDNNPEMSATDLKRVFDELHLDVVIPKFNALVEMLNGAVKNSITDSEDEIPTCKAITDYIIQTGNGDMMKMVYDTDNDGVVDNAKSLDGHGTDYFQSKEDNLLNTTSKDIVGAINEVNTTTGTWIGPYTIPSGSTSYVISDAYITATSIIDVYPSNDTADIMAAASPSVSQSVQTAGSLTIVFETATTAAITIEAVKVVNL